MYTVTITNHKGGSAKTTTTVSLAAAFGELGYRSLVVDLDPQGSATAWLGHPAGWRGMAEFGAGGLRVSDIAVSTTAERVDLVPACPTLVTQDPDRAVAIGLDIVRGFRRIPDYWDFVLVDTPPTVGYLSLAPLVASSHVVIPVEAHALAMAGVASVIESIGRAQTDLKSPIGLLAILPCRVNATLHTRDVVARLRAEYGDAVLDATVRESIRAAEAPAFRMPLTRYAPRSQVAWDYRDVVAQLLVRLGLDPAGKRRSGAA
jgi:chromosome partitioning protein